MALCVATEDESTLRLPEPQVSKPKWNAPAMGSAERNREAKKSAIVVAKDLIKLSVGKCVRVKGVKSMKGDLWRNNKIHVIKEISEEKGEYRVELHPHIIKFKKENNDPKLIINENDEGEGIWLSNLNLMPVDEINVFNKYIGKEYRRFVGNFRGEIGVKLMIIDKYYKSTPKKMKMSFDLLTCESFLTKDCFYENHWNLFNPISIRGGSGSDQTLGECGVVMQLKDLDGDFLFIHYYPVVVVGKKFDVKTGEKIEMKDDEKDGQDMKQEELSKNDDANGKYQPWADPETKSKIVISPTMGANVFSNVFDIVLRDSKDPRRKVFYSRPKLKGERCIYIVRNEEVDKDKYYRTVGMKQDISKKE